ncbi:MAG: LysR family transcriptional regulator [Pseudomonadota bacterium]
MENSEPPFTFRAVQIFVSAVDAQSVTKAAGRLGISASTVSQQLAALEAALGARLIERSARRFRLTGAGDLFLARAKRLLDDVGAAKAELALAEQAPQMALNIASVEELDASVTAPWLRRLTERFPNTSFTLTSGASHENHDALASRAADLIVAVDTVAAVHWVEQHLFLRDPFILVAAHAVDPASKLADLAARPFIRYAPELLIGRRIEAQLRRTGTIPARGFEFTTNRALFAMTAELDGWALTTALAFLGTPGAEKLVRPHPLPLPRFARQLGLHARKGALGGLPRLLASELADCIDRHVIPAARDRLGFLDTELRVILDDPHNMND